MSDDIGAFLTLHYVIPSDLMAAGEASSSVRNKLIQLGVSSQKVKKAAISMYEAEINAVIHAGGGEAFVYIKPEKIVIVLEDHGPGIPDIEQAMQEGFSTAPERIREMGFGAGMGLPNMKRYSDRLDIKSEVGKGTTITIEVDI